MIDTQQQYIKLNIRGEISIIGVQAHSGRKRDILVFKIQHMLFHKPSVLHSHFCQFW
jgi:hypothetical protein